MDIYICVGSSCHLKGSYDIIQGFQRLIKEHNIENEINLNASFCLGHCTGGVAVKVDDFYIENLTRENYEELFNKHVLERIKK